MLKAINKNGKSLKIGDLVGFKCDVEQYGKIVGINKPSGMFSPPMVVLSNPNGFDGEYINGNTETTESIDDVWKDEWYC
tara:strand:+ start:448 stop:684 length:237 start_codon:yes stop_codon:yes gene_type:complete